VKKLKMAADHEELNAKVHEYLRLDKDPKTHAQMRQLLEAEDFETLRDLVEGRLSFGTAGLRAAIGPGYTRMNGLTVIQTTQGLCRVLEASMDDFKSKGVVIGHDHRHRSQDFAEWIGGVFLSQSVKVHFYRRTVHTPLVPFAVTELGAACGIMITASHNPKQDNGYKLYAANGCQIISPLDRDISKSIL
jgi:phosphomannomutase